MIISLTSTFLELESAYISSCSLATWIYHEIDAKLNETVAKWAFLIMAMGRNCKVITSCQSWFLLKKLHCESGFTGSANVEFEHMFIGSLPYLSYGPRFLFVRFKPFWILLSATLRRVPSLPAPCSIVIQVGAQCGCQSSEAQHRCMAQKWSIVGTNSRLLRDTIFHDFKGGRHTWVFVSFLIFHDFSNTLLLKPTKRYVPENTPERKSSCKYNPLQKYHVKTLQFGPPWNNLPTNWAWCR